MCYYVKPNPTAAAKYNRKAPEGSIRYDADMFSCCLTDGKHCTEA